MYSDPHVAGRWEQKQERRRSGWRGRGRGDGGGGIAWQDDGHGSQAPPDRGGYRGGVRGRGRGRGNSSFVIKH